MTEAICKSACPDCPLLSSIAQNVGDYGRRFPETNLRIIQLIYRLVNLILKEGQCEGPEKISLPSAYFVCGNEFAAQAAQVRDAGHIPLSQAGSIESSR